MLVNSPGEQTPGRSTGQGAEEASNQNGVPANGNAPTVAQFRRFIKSRSYVPLHELRRRFELNGDLDEVSRIRTPDGPVYVGLPPLAADLIGQLVRDGEIGLELLRDPHAPVVVGVFPMKPVTRT